MCRLWETLFKGLQLLQESWIRLDVLLLGRSPESCLYCLTLVHLGRKRADLVSYFHSIHFPNSDQIQLAIAMLRLFVTSDKIWKLHKHVFGKNPFEWPAMTQEEAREACNLRHNIVNTNPRKTWLEHIERVTRDIGPRFGVRIVHQTPDETFKVSFTKISFKLLSGFSCRSLTDFTKRRSFSCRWRILQLKRVGSELFTVTVH